MATRGSYIGGSTVIGARSGWFSFKENKKNRKRGRKSAGRLRKSKNRNGAHSEEKNSDLNKSTGQVAAERAIKESNTGLPKHRIAVIWDGEKYVKAPEQNDTSPTSRTKKSR